MLETEREYVNRDIGVIRDYLGREVMTIGVYEGDPDCFESRPICVGGDDIALTVAQAQEVVAWLVEAIRIASR